MTGATARAMAVALAGVAGIALLGALVWRQSRIL